MRWLQHRPHEAARAAGIQVLLGIHPNRTNARYLRHVHTMMLFLAVLLRALTNGTMVFICLIAPHPKVRENKKTLFFESQTRRGYLSQVYSVNIIL